MGPSVSSGRHNLDARLLREVRSAPGYLIANLVSNALGGLAILAQAWFLSQVIQRAFILEQPLEPLAPLLLAILVTILARVVLAYQQSWTSARVAMVVKERLRSQLVTHLTTLGPAYTRQERSGDLSLTATEGIEKLDGYFRDYLPAIFNALFLPVLIALVVLPLDGLTLVVFLLTAPLIPFFAVLIGMATGAIARNQFLEMRYLGAHFLDVMQGLTTLKLFNRSQHQVETIGRISRQYRKSTMRVLRVAFLSALTLEMLATLSVAIVAVEIGVRLLYGGIPFEQALFLLMVAPEFYLPLRTLGAKFHNATEGKAAAERLYAILDIPLPVQNQINQQFVPESYAIRFEDVSVTYAGRQLPAVHGCSFRIESGQRVAIVGPSGSGKTTLSQLLLGFLKPDTGRILIGGVDLQQIPREEWYRHLAWVSQTPYLFNDTIEGNIRVGHPGANQSEVVEAARAAGIHDFITQLPEGYGTSCGERGLRLSGGQAQRIALARAFLRDAPVVLLDEPTSQLDPVTEAYILDELHDWFADRTLILITHRLNAAIRMDQILVIEAGTVVEQGTPDLLLKTSGAWARLIEQESGRANAR